MFDYSTNSFFSIGGDLRDSTMRSINYSATMCSLNPSKNVYGKFYDFNNDGLKTNCGKSYLEQVDELTK